MVTDRHGRGLQTGVHLELRQDALNVGPNGVATDAQPARDRASVGALHEQAEHLSLPRGELRDEQSDTVGRSTAMTCGNEAVGKDHLPINDGFHRADEPSDRRVLREVATEPRLEGLIDDPRVIEAAREALTTWGFGMASVRFICGTQTIHRTLEERLARFLGAEDRRERQPLDSTHCYGFDVSQQPVPPRRPKVYRAGRYCGATPCAIRKDSIHS